MSRVAMVLRTSGLEYDDRVRKECSSLADAGADVSVVHIAEKNLEDRGPIWGTATAISFRLRTRGWFRRSHGLTFKLLEFTLRSALELIRQEPDVAWLHNKEVGALLPLAFLFRRLGWVGAVVWDQHELPPESMLRGFMNRRLLRWMVNRCDVLVVANRERREYLMERLGEDLGPLIVVLENWPDRKFAELEARPLPEEVRAWLGHRRYLLAQGGASPGRHFEHLVAAIISGSDLALVVVGGVRDELYRRLRERWGKSFEEAVFFTGWIPQMDMCPVIDHALASVVLYDDRQPNTRLCAPNRLYQALARGTPVLVGSNPPMATVVERLGVGVVLEGSGDNRDDILAGVDALLAKRELIEQRVMENKARFSWERQDASFLTIVRTAGVVPREREQVPPG